MSLYIYVYIYIYSIIGYLFTLLVAASSRSPHSAPRCSVALRELRGLRARAGTSAIPVSAESQ